MAVVQTFPAHERRILPTTTRQSWLRLVLLSILLSISIAFSVYFLFTAPPDTAPTKGFISTWQLSFLPYIAACILVLVTKAPVGRRRWIELGLILLGALALRAIIIPVLPDLSRDSWRYLWDARVTLHGYSPYVYAPGDPTFASLWDFIYANSRFRSVPTIYPPGAQGIYLLSYLVAPSNLFVLKGVFVGFDVASCAALAFLLQREGLDMSRCIIYAWCPLPIIEFAIEGHLDASTITFTILAILCARATWRGSRVLTGFLIALATLTKIYPILLLVAVVRRRDWALLTTCFATIILGYAPYLILGHGQVLGFFSTYASEQTPNAGITQFVVVWMENQFALNKPLGSLLIDILDIILVVTVSLIVLRLRWQKRLSMEAATFLLIGTIFAVSSHIFSWYAAAFLPWIATQIGPLWAPWRSVTQYASWNKIKTLRIPWSKIKTLRIPRSKIWALRSHWKDVRNIRIDLSFLRYINEGTIATLAAWYFACYSITAYFLDWRVYYQHVYGITLSGLGIALVLSIIKYRYFYPHKRIK